MVTCDLADSWGRASLLPFLLLPVLPAAAKGPGSATITGPGGSIEVSPGNYRYVERIRFGTYRTSRALSLSP